MDSIGVMPNGSAFSVPDWSSSTGLPDWSGSVSLPDWSSSSGGLPDWSDATDADASFFDSLGTAETDQTVGDGNIIARQIENGAAAASAGSAAAAATAPGSRVNILA